MIGSLFFGCMCLFIIRSFKEYYLGKAKRISFSVIVALEPSI